MHPSWAACRTFCWVGPLALHVSDIQSLASRLVERCAACESRLLGQHAVCFSTS